MKLIKLLTPFLVVAGFAAAQATSVVVPAVSFFPATGYPPIIQGTYVKTSATASVTTFNFQCPAASVNASVANPTYTIQPVAQVAQSTVCPAGLYRISVYAENASGTNGGGSLTTTVGFHSTATAQTANPTSSLTCGTGDYQAGSTTFYSDGTLNITFASAVSSTCTYNLVATLERLY